MQRNNSLFKLRTITIVTDLTGEDSDSDHNNDKKSTLTQSNTVTLNKNVNLTFKQLLIEQ